jgi:hypothetical protein
VYAHATTAAQNTKCGEVDTGNNFKIGRILARNSVIVKRLA